MFTNHKAVTNQPYRLPWDPAGVWNNFVLDIAQVNTSADADMLVAVNAPLNEDNTVNTADAISLSTGAFYTANLTVDVNSRDVEYMITDTQGEPVISGTWSVPETDANGDPISMYAEGMYVMTARYQAKFYFDNIKISYESSESFANKPTVALTRLGQTADEVLDLDVRAYTITFLEGEELHVTGTDGVTTDVDWADCDGNYVYETKKSGVLKAWTTCEGATSEVVEVEVDCSPCALPSVTATVTSVKAGYGKTYTLTISNADVPLRPTIFINYEYTGANGEKIAETGAASGVQVPVTQEGTLKVTSTCFGYQATTIEVENDVEFSTKKVYDFARMSDEEAAAAGFTSFNVLNSATQSGFNNWTARKRLFYYDAATETVDPESGETVYTAVYPFGFIADDNTTNVIEYSEINDNPDGSVHFEGLNVFEGRNLSYIKHVGIYNNETAGGNNKNIIINNLDENDFVVCNYIDNYGGNSNHPVVNTKEEYFAALEGADVVYSVATDGVLNEETGKYSVTYPLYRIQDACTKISIFKQEGAGIEGVTADNAEEILSNDPYYYSIDGLRWEAPVRPGLYIHKGKKVVIK